MTSRRIITFFLLAATLPSFAFGGVEMRDAAIIRGPTLEKKIALVFTGHEFAEGGEMILESLAQHHAKGSFFFTGDFLADTNFAPIIQRVVREGHYLGPHSDKHLLYCSWDKKKNLLISRDEFRADLERNLDKIEKVGVSRSRIQYFLPPYEQSNEQIADWARQMHLELVNFTPGTRSNADYTGESDENFVPTKTIFDSIVAKEQKDPNGLNGFLLLLHIGSGPNRGDKFHQRFGELLDYLTSKGYQFVRVDELLQ